LKLWAVNADGTPRLDERGKLIRRTPKGMEVSLVTAISTPGAVECLHDVEGEIRLVRLRGGRRRERRREYGRSWVTYGT